jgi:hypothetical protein
MKNKPVKVLWNDKKKDYAIFSESLAAGIMALGSVENYNRGKSFANAKLAAAAIAKAKGGVK